MPPISRKIVDFGMYPFMTGFYLTASISVVGLAVILGFHDLIQKPLPPPIYTFIAILIYLSPFFGQGFIYYRTYGKGIDKTRQRSMRRYFVGGLTGALVVLVVASLLLPHLRS